MIKKNYGKTISIDINQIIYQIRIMNSHDDDNVDFILILLSISEVTSLSY